MHYIKGKRHSVLPSPFVKVLCSPLLAYGSTDIWRQHLVSWHHYLPKQGRILSFLKHVYCVIHWKLVVTHRKKSWLLWELWSLIENECETYSIPQHFKNCKICPEYQLFFTMGVLFVTYSHANLGTGSSAGVNHISPIVFIDFVGNRVTLHIYTDAVKIRIGFKDCQVRTQDGYKLNKTKDLAFLWALLHRTFYKWNSWLGSICTSEIPWSSSKNLTGGNWGTWMHLRQ